MADTKANILLSISSVITTIVLTRVTDPKLEDRCGSAVDLLIAHRPHGTADVDSRTSTSLVRRSARSPTGFQSVVLRRLRQRQIR